MIVFSVDPGPHTGVFYFKNEMPHFMLLDLRGHVTPHKVLYMWLMANVNPQEDTVVCETFEFRKDDAQNRAYIDYSVGELVGAVALFCQLSGAKHVKQMASVGKGFWNDNKLERVGLLFKGKDSKHIRDATRHWLHYHTFGGFAAKNPDVSNYWLRKLMPR